MNKFYFAFVFLLFLSGVSAHGGEDNFSHHGMMSGFYGMGFFGWIFMILVIIVLVLFIIWLAKQLREKPRRKR